MHTFLERKTFEFFFLDKVFIPFYVIWLLFYCFRCMYVKHLKTGLILLHTTLTIQYNFCFFFSLVSAKCHRVQCKAVHTDTLVPSSHFFFLLFFFKYVLYKRIFGTLGCARRMMVHIKYFWIAFTLRWHFTASFSFVIVLVHK